jgi:hypothetical protein
MKDQLNVEKTAGATAVVIGTIVAIAVVGLIVLMLWKQIIAVVS